MAKAFACVPSGDIDYALHMFREQVPLVGRAPDVFEWTKLLNLVGIHGTAFEALRVFESISFAGLDPDVIAFNSVVNIFCKHSLVDEALSMVRRMHVEFGLTPDMRTFYPIVQELERRGEPEKIKQILTAAQTLFHLDADQLALRSLVLAYIKKGDFDSSIRLIEELSRLVFEESIVTHEILRAMFLRKTPIEQVEKFWAVLQTKSGGPDCFEYSMLFRIYEAFAKWEKCLHLFQGSPY